MFKTTYQAVLEKGPISAPQGHPAIHQEGTSSTRSSTIIHIVLGKPKAMYIGKKKGFLPHHPPRQSEINLTKHIRDTDSRRQVFFWPNLLS